MILKVWINQAVHPDCRHQALKLRFEASFSLSSRLSILNQKQLNNNQSVEQTTAEIEEFENLKKVTLFVSIANTAGIARTTRQLHVI